jgi:hypothetical protein
MSNPTTTPSPVDGSDQPDRKAASPPDAPTDITTPAASTPSLTSPPPAVTTTTTATVPPTSTTVPPTTTTAPPAATTGTTTRPTTTPTTSTPSPLAIDDRPPLQSSFRAGLLVAAFPGIVIALTATIGIYLVLVQSGTDEVSNQDRYTAVGIGILVGIVFVFANAYVFQHHTSPDHMNPRQYGELRERWTTLDAELGMVCPAPTGSETQKAACISALAHRNYIAEELAIPKDAKKSTGGRWALGSAFVDLWVRLHDAEASLFILQAREQVVANGLFDEHRLIGSDMKNHDLMLAQLRGAITVLGGKEYLVSATAAEDTGTPGTTPQSNSPPVSPESGARMVLSNIRRTINSIRDESRAGLLQTRNYLIWTGMVTLFVTYALLALAILMGASESTIVAALTFFLVGGLVGLFSQLRSTSSETVRSGEDDFGLALARLIYVPVLSGLAGIGGVLVMTMLYPSLGVPLDVSTSAAGVSTPQLAEIFDLSRNGFGLLVAAVFGLTPDLLINRLQGQADQYKSKLAETGVETRGPTPPK